jgi:hypothetical protein
MCLIGRGNRSEKKAGSFACYRASANPGHTEDHQGAVDERLVILNRMQELKRDHEKECTDDRAKQVVQPAKEAVEQEIH